MKKTLFVLLLCAVLALCPLAQADGYRHATASPTPSPFGTLIGAVSDEGSSGAKLSGVKVTAGDRSTTTDANGRYALDLMPGSYDVTFEKAGYVSVTSSATLRADTDTTLNTSLTKDGAKLTGTVSDAIDPSVKLSGVQVSAGGQSATTDSSGRYALDMRPGTYTVSFEKNGYISTSNDVTLRAGSDATLNCSMSKALQSNEYRVVLTWGNSPKDLDSHLLGRSAAGTSYHVYFNAKTPSAANGEAQLDVDERYGEGPETITFKVTGNQKYVYYVFDYTNGSATLPSAMGRSGAKVNVYCGNQHVLELDVPSQSGKVWHVFTIEGGVLSVDNYINDAKP